MLAYSLVSVLSTSVSISGISYTGSGESALAVVLAGLVMVMLAFLDLFGLHSKHTREAVSAPRENITTEEVTTETLTGTPSDVDDSVDSRSKIEK